MERILTELVLKLKKATGDDVRAALRDLQAWHAAGKKGDLCDVLVQHGVISERAARTLRMLATKQAGPKIAGFEIIEPLGGGGMGVVFKARQIALDRIVALKILAPEVLDDAEAVARFRREARAAGKLDHPNIVKAYDVSVGNPATGEPPYLVMEFVTGETLHQILSQRQTLSENHALRIGSGIAAALDHAYRAGLVHRDVKPDNIMITPKGEVKLCDLGLAKMIVGDQSITRPDMTHGTPHFMSPEQAQGRRDLDIRSDLYSLGCTLFRVVIGRAPFIANSAMEILLKHIEMPPPSPKAIRPDLSIEFERIVLKLLAKDPAKRYQYPAHVQTDLELVLAGEKPRLDYGMPFRPILPASDAGESLPPAPEPPSGELEFASSTTDEHAKTLTGTGADQVIELADELPPPAAKREGQARRRKSKTLPPGSETAASGTTHSHRQAAAKTKSRTRKAPIPKGWRGTLARVQRHLSRDRKWQVAALIGGVTFAAMLVGAAVLILSQVLTPGTPTDNEHISVTDDGGGDPDINGRPIPDATTLTPDAATRRAWLAAAESAELRRLETLETSAAAARSDFTAAFGDLRGDKK